MKKQNSVYLSGELAEVTCETVLRDGSPAPVVHATLVTDHPAYGGHHRVLFADRLALELRAFRAANQDAPLEVTVDGWLRSQRGQVVVVADRVMYHVSDAVRQEAGRLTDRLLALAGQRR